LSEDQVLATSRHIPAFDVPPAMLPPETAASDVMATPRGRPVSTIEGGADKPGPSAQP
jgi:hypothetical protein